MNNKYDEIKPVEVPLKKRKSLLSIAIILMFVILTISFVAIVVLEILEINVSIRMIFIEFGAVLVMIPVLIVLDAVVKVSRLKKICTYPTVGKFVDYEIKRQKTKHGYSDSYAPKYRVFVNGRYEIRTLDSFGAKNKKLTADTPMLVNPNGCEIIPENYSLMKNELSSIITAVMFIIFAIIACLFLFRDIAAL